MNAGPAQATCPRCGRVTGVRALPEVLAELGRQASQARRRPAANPPQRSPARRYGQDDYTLGDDQGDSGLPGQGLADIGAAVAAEVLRRTVGRALKKHYQERVAPSSSEEKTNSAAASWNGPSATPISDTAPMTGSCS